MKKSLLISGQKINYVLIRRKGTKCARVSLRRDGELVLSLPWYCPARFGKALLEENAALIKAWIQKFAENKKNAPPADPLKSYRHCKSRARKFIHERVKECNKIYQFSFNRIAIKDHYSRWGSCSGKKNLNFNYRLLFLPIHLADYVVAHELSHLRELNHSPRFWALVAKVIPDYRKRRLELKRREI
ncbi:MAG: M48 family metallopeptidase [Patescibacteria group bacterium]|mgnify:CR=1 FL=1